MPRIQIITTFALTTVTALMCALPVPANTGAEDFNQLDTNADAVINFAEFSAFAATQGQTRTRAAQTFIDLANGDMLITKVEYLFGVSVTESPTWTRGYALPELTTDVETIETVTLDGQTIEITPNEEIASEAIRPFEGGRLEDDLLDDDRMDDDPI